MFICFALAVIQLLLVTPGSHQSFQSLATPVSFSAINVFLVMLCFQTNKLDDDLTNISSFCLQSASRRYANACVNVFQCLQCMSTTDV